MKKSTPSQPPPSTFDSSLKVALGSPFDRGPLAAIAFLTIAAGLLPGQAPPVWMPLGPSAAPSWRYYTDMASDLHRGRIVLFGGSDWNGTNLADTLEWDGGTWMTRQPATVPPARSGHALAYDPIRQRMVMFGGIISDPAHTYRDDTWEWDGQGWQQRLPTSKPSPRRLHAMAWDGVSQKVLFFSGKVGFAAWSNDTWQWDGVNWVQLSLTVSPPARDGHRMAYDSGRHRVVMFGGYTGSSGSNDTWEWTGSQWIATNPAHRPPVRTNHCMCFDPTRNRTIIAGGQSNDTWEWDGTDWQQIATLSTPPVMTIGSDLAFDPVNQAPLITCPGPNLGQNTPPQETWLLQPSPLAQATPFGLGCPGSNGIPTVTATNLPRLNTAFRIDATNLPTYAPQLAVGFFGFSNTSWGFHILPMDLASQGLPGCSLLVAPPPPGLILSTFTQNGTCSWQYLVPWHPLFLGARLYFQALIPDSQAGNPLGASVTNGIELVLGL